MTPHHEPTTSLPVDPNLATGQGGTASWADIERRLAPYFVRAAPRQRALAYLRGLRSSAERKTSWQLAEVSGEATPDGFQHVLGRADWEADALRDARRRDMVPQRGDPDGVLGLDETGFPKKGRHSAGVARQDSGTAGRIEHGQIGVFLGYAGRLGHALRERELYGPQEWTDDRERGRQAGIPDERRLATKPQLARQMLARALGAGVLAKWVTGDSVDGDDRRLRRWLEAQPQGYVLAVSGQEDVWLGWQQRQVKTTLAALPEAGWTRRSAGDGAKGPRWDDGCWLARADPVEPHWRRWLLVRRRVSAPTELRAYVVFAPAATTLEEVVRVAGTRWTIASGMEAAKGAGGVDPDDVRRWIGWYRHLTLALWALALLAVMRAGAIAVEALQKTLRPAPERSSLAAFKASRGLPCR
jgi:SRSO17 transposase